MLSGEGTKQLRVDVLKEVMSLCYNTFTYLLATLKRQEKENN